MTFYNLQAVKTTITLGFKRVYGNSKSTVRSFVNKIMAAKIKINHKAADHHQTTTNRNTIENGNTDELTNVSEKMECDVVEPVPCSPNPAETPNSSLGYKTLPETYPISQQISRANQEHVFESDRLFLENIKQMINTIHDRNVLDEMNLFVRETSEIYAWMKHALEVGNGNGSKCYDRGFGSADKCQQDNDLVQFGKHSCRDLGDGIRNVKHVDQSRGITSSVAKQCEELDALWKKSVALQQEIFTRMCYIDLENEQKGIVQSEEVLS